MGTKYRIAVFLSFLTIILVLMFSAFHFKYMGMPDRQTGSGFRIETLHESSFAGNDMKPAALLVVGITALMAGGVLWSVVNYKG
ncbi:MAG: hypothetical protein ABSC14_06210 [Desulfomonilia bacterium]